MSRRFLVFAWVAVCSLGVPAPSLLAQDTLSILVASPANQSARRQIDQIMARQVTINLQDMPLSTVVDALSVEHGLNMLIDESAFEMDLLSPDLPVTVRLSEVPLGGVLDLMLRPAGLTWIVQHGVVLITTPTVEEEHLETRVYLVGELIRQGEEPLTWEDFQPLIKALESAVDPDSWDSVSGGPATLSPVPTTGTLVCSQTRAGHDKVLHLLTSLYQASGRQPAAVRPTAPPPLGRAAPAAPRQYLPYAEWQVPRLHVHVSDQE